MSSYIHTLVLSVDTIMVFEHRLFMLLCVCSSICRKMLDIRAADMRSWRWCRVCQIYYPTLALTLCPCYLCDRPVLSDCCGIPPIESFTCSSWVFTDWDIWLCRDCQLPMTEQMLYPVEVDCEHRRLCRFCLKLEREVHTSGRELAGREGINLLTIHQHLHCKRATFLIGGRQKGVVELR